jgi:hypothetical protein
MSIVTGDVATLLRWGSPDAARTGGRLPVAGDGDHDRSLASVARLPSRCRKDGFEVLGSDPDAERLAGASALRRRRASRREAQIEHDVGPALSLPLR